MAIRLLVLVATIFWAAAGCPGEGEGEGDVAQSTLTSPLLPGFSFDVATIRG